jgi:hypothetical protein
MTEKRVVDMSAPDDQGTYHSDWTCTFTAGERDVILDRTPLEGEPGGKPWGGYAGLSVRFAKDLAERQVVTTKGPVKFAGQLRFRGKARAMDYSGLIQGGPVGVAAFDYPENLHHPTPWYAIKSQPMSYFSPAVICDGPFTLKAGQRFTLRYRVMVHANRWDAPRLEKEYRRFAGESD